MPNEMMSNPPLSAQHAATTAHLPGSGLTWLGDLRDQALASYRAAGLPSRKLENWRHTPLEHLSALGLDPAELANPPAIDTVPAWQRDLIQGHSIVFVNGRYHPGLSRLSALPDGARIHSLADLLDREPELVEPHIGRLAALQDHALTALNTAYLGDGVVIRLDPGTVLDEPLHLVNIAAPAVGAIAIQPRHLVILGDGAQMTLVESHGGLGDTAYLSNSVMEIALAANARLHHVKVQRETATATHLASTAVSVAQGAYFNAFTLHAGATLARQETYVDINGPHGEARVNGVYLAGARQQQDNLTLIVHDTTDSLSRQNFRGVIDARGKGVFQGKVLVKRGAQRTDGHQLNRVLLLAPGARIDAKPELEIYADDVKCSHGATAGELDEDALFYLRARGIPEPIARRMLVEAFAGEAVDEISDETLRQSVMALVRTWLDDHVGAVT
ncbi:MAG: Fe-S cluster assembly protein SufD [Alphaproteobacteria bacterium]